MTLGSLFDGAGTCCFAAELCGITPVWSSEIERFPLEVTKKRFPNVKQLGDVTKINGAEIKPVDIISFGSPCQDLSVAGKRAGLKGERSGLFMEAIRIIKEMRHATANEFPRFIVWENVFGAFSSNNGEDFRTVLEELCKIKDGSASVPRPTEGHARWSGTGYILGDGYSVAWRVFDAQFWGVPQRRRRIYLVADFGGGCAGEILFERDGLQRRFAESRQSWEDRKAPAPSQNRSLSARECFDARGNGDGAVCPTLTGDHENRITDYTALLIEALTHPSKTFGVDPYNQSLTGEIAASLGTNCGLATGRNAIHIAFNLLQDPITSKDVSSCLSSGNSKTGQAAIGVCIALDRAAFNQGIGAKYDFGIDKKTMFTLTAKGPGAICYAIGNGQADQLRLNEIVGALNCMHDEQAILCAYCLQGNGIDRSNKAGCNGMGVKEEVGYTLNTIDRHAVCLCVATQQGGAEIMREKSPTITASAGMSGNNQPWICFIGINGEKVGTLDAHYFKGCGEREGKERDIVCMVKCSDKMKFVICIVRRLTPTECARLQGMPDWWCSDVPHADAPEYKMWGNGMALPCVLYIFEGLKKCDKKRRITS